MHSLEISWLPPRACNSKKLASGIGAVHWTKTLWCSCGSLNQRLNICPRSKRFETQTIGPSFCFHVVNDRKCSYNYMTSLQKSNGVGDGNLVKKLILGFRCRPQKIWFKFWTLNFCSCSLLLYILECILGSRAPDMDLTQAYLWWAMGSNLAKERLVHICVSVSILFSF